MDKRSRILRLNIISSFVFYVVYAITGFIHPKLLLNAFGSELYGLTASVARFLSMISLAEGGITAVVAANLYKPLSEKNGDKVSEILTAADRYFKRIGIIFAAYSVIMGFIYPLIVRDYGVNLILPLSIVSALPTVMSYLTWKSLRCLISSDERSYIVNLELSVTSIANVIFVFIAIKIFPNLVFVKFASFLAYVLQPLIYYWYCKREYKFLNRKADIGDERKILSQRKDGFSHSLADYIHNNTDYYVLTIFSSLVNIAIYAVYEMVIVSLRNAISSIATSLSPSFGKILASGNKEEAGRFFEEYELIVNFLIAVIFSCVAVLLLPFVRIYTANLHDADYVFPLFALVFTLAGITDCLRFPYTEAARAAGKFRETKNIAYAEAVINLVLSIVLVIKYDLVGVVVATIIAMTFRFLTEGTYVSRNIIGRSLVKFFLKLLLCLGTIALNYFVCTKLFSYDVKGYLGWIIVAFETGILSLLISGIMYYVFDGKASVRTVKVLLNRGK